MNIQDKADDEIVIESLVHYFAELSDLTESLARKDWGADEPTKRATAKIISEKREIMRRINSMLARWKSPEN